MAPAMKQTLSTAIKSETGQLETVRAFVEDAAREFGFPDDDIANIVLAVDEACTNIIKHAYGGATNGTIEIDVRRKGKTFSIHIKDNGKAFNPDGIEPPNLRQHLTEFRRGGLGVYLMRRLMDKVEYAIHPGKSNEVTLVKYRSEAV